MTRIIIESPAGGGELEVEQSVFDAGFFPDFHYVRDAGPSPSTEPDVLDQHVAGLFAAGSSSKTMGAARAAFVPTFGVAVPTGTAATDTANIAARLSDAAAAGGGVVMLQGGTYVVNATLVLQSGVILAGQGIGTTIVQLAAGSNVDLLQTKDFVTLTGTGGFGGQELFGLYRLTLDANKSGNTSGWVARFYGKNYRVSEVRFANGPSGGVWTEWGSGAGEGTRMEATWESFRISDCVGTSLNLLGPHDSMFANGIIDIDSATTPGGHGVHVSATAGSNPVFTGVHVFGSYDYCWYLDTQALLVNCQGEGASIAEVMAGSQGVTIMGGAYFGARVTTEERGIQIGDATHSNVSGVTVDTFIYNLGANSYPIYVWSTGGQNRIKATVRCDRTTGTWMGGSPDPTTDLYEIVGGGDAARNYISYPTQVVFDGGFYTNGAGTFSVDSTEAFTVRGASGAAQFSWDTTSYAGKILDGGSLYGYNSSNAPSSRWDGNVGAFQPGNPAGIGARLFSGSGAPTFSANSGDFYFRSDTPATANQRLYVCTGGTSWTAIL